MTAPITHARAGRCPVARAAALLLASLPADRAQASLLRLGPNDWILRAGIARRSERNGAAFGEREIAIERTLRRGDKPQQDQALADPTLGLRFAQERGGAERVLGLSVSLPFGAAVRDARVQAGSAALAGAEARLRGLQQQCQAGDSRLAADLAAIDLQQARARLLLARQHLLPAQP